MNVQKKWTSNADLQTSGVFSSIFVVGRIIPLKVYAHLSEFAGVQRPVMTTGTFDGVHLGHRVIIERLKEIAQKVDGETVMLTFDPHPRMVLFPEDHGLKLLNTKHEKIERLRAAGIDHLIIHPFSLDFAKLSALEYVREVLIDGIDVYRMVVGYDHRFGKNREGNFKSLQEYAEMFEFGVEEIPAQMVDDVNVSSTKIRRALATGDVATANDYLSYNYPMHGVVIEGDGIGKTLGFPTANLQIEDPNKLIPAHGVYVCMVSIEGKRHRAMMNIGTRPTVTSTRELRIEVHVIGSNENLYGKSITVEFVDWLRNEQRFENEEALVQQLHEDRTMALERLA